MWTPSSAHGDTDITVDEMNVTVGEFYQRALDQQLVPASFPSTPSARHLQHFEAAQEECSPRRRFLRENRKILVDKVNYWTGVQRPLVKKLVESIEAKVSDLDLRPT